MKDGISLCPEITSALFGSVGREIACFRAESREAEAPTLAMAVMKISDKVVQLNRCSGCMSIIIS